jgi:HD-GYP domain-containing protein (c-di-GMP phosphodiesterase class II)
LSGSTAGTLFDPTVADLFSEHAWELLDGLDEAASWDAVLDAEPSLARRVEGSDLDDVLRAMADLVDLKSPYLAGHSRGVANLAGEAARVSGLSGDEVVTVRRLASSTILAGSGCPTRSGTGRARSRRPRSERVRLHPYLTDRMLTPVATLGRVREIASRHHGRLDGSGYPRGG